MNKYNQYRNNSDVNIIPLYNKNNVIIDYTIIDKIDLHHITRKFRSDKGRYAKYNIYENRKSKCIYLHRLILNAPDSLEVDHINGDGLDNRRINLRLTTHSQNLQNQKTQSNTITGYRNITFDKTRNLYMVQIKKKGMKTFKKRCRSLEEAKILVDNKRIEFDFQLGNRGIR